jgi:uncharacterized protein (DUF4415 family)
MCVGHRDPDKYAINRRKHRLPLSVGEVSLADPLALSRLDPHPDGDLWDTICLAGCVVLLIVHNWPDADDVPGRIISVREATRRERRATRMVKVRKLTVKERAALKAVATMPDSEIDTSDSPEVRDWNGAVRRALYRPVKRLTSLRLDADLLEWFRRGGEGYQTRINAALREYVERHQRQERR